MRVEIGMMHLSNTTPSGSFETIPVLRLNSFFRFHDAYVDSTSIANVINDPLYLVAIFSLKDLMSWYKGFTIKDMLKIQLLHGVYISQGRKIDYTHSLQIHECSDVCRNIIYVFKSSNRKKEVIAGFSGVFALPNRQARTPTVSLNLGNKENNINAGSGMAPELNDCRYDCLTLPDRGLKALIIKQWETEMTTEALRFVVCSCCAKRVVLSDSVWVDGRTIDLTLLRNDALDEAITPSDYNFHAYGRALLNIKGLERIDTVGKMRLCKRCMKSLSNGHMPKFALANWLYYGNSALPNLVKRAFDDASLFEKMLVGRARCNSICCRFNFKGGSFNDTVPSSKNDILANSRKGIRGNVMLAPLDAIRMNKVIPPSSDFIRDTMCAVFVGETLPTRSTIHKFSPVLVRKSRVKLMIEFLIQCNGHYQPSIDFAFSQDNLDSLFNSRDLDESVPSTVTIGHVPMNDAIANSTSDYTLRNMDTLEPEIDELLMENVSYTDGDDSPAGYHAMKSVALERCLQGKPFIASGTGSTNIQDFYNPSALTWLYPHLDPWGIGGFHHPLRRVPIGMEEQLKHLLMIDTSPFERDPEFAFVFYNIVQKLRVMTSLRFSVPLATHRSIIRDLLDADPDIFVELARECEKDPFYHPTNESQKKAFALLNSIGMISRHIPGSNGYKISRRNEIRSLTQYRGTATLFVTLSPSDVNNPIVRLYAGEDIDLEDISRGEDLNEWRRKLLASRNPVACALFFDLMIKKFIKVILRHGDDVDGLYGRCDSYYGTVEAQGTGTLHCHMLIWLHGHLSPQKMRDRMLDSEDYQQKLFRWLESVIKCEFPAEAGNQVVERVRAKDLGIPHPGTVPSPSITRALNEDNFWEDFQYSLTQLLNEYNYHVHQATCWKYLGRGQEKTDHNCRMGMNGETRPITYLDPDTCSVVLRRLHPWIASHSDVVTFLMKCNSDIKFIGSGDAAKAFLVYVTDYVTKPSLQVHVGMAALTYAVQKTYSKMPDIKADSEPGEILSAVTIAVNSTMGRHEISHPQVMSYLVGGGDHYTCETFVVMQWGLIHRYATKVWEQPNIFDNAVYDERIGMNVRRREISATNQQMDYIYRPETGDYNSMCVYEFVSRVKKSRIATNRSTQNEAINGRFCSWEHSEAATHCLTISKACRIPVLLGPSIPNPNRSEETKEFWARDILFLFKPWRNPLDLKGKDETWLHAYQSYQGSIPVKYTAIIANINVFNECKEARDLHRIKSRAQECVDENCGATTFELLVEAAESDLVLDAVVSDADQNLDSSNSMRIFEFQSNDEHESIDTRICKVLGRDVLATLNMCLPENKMTDIIGGSTRLDDESSRVSQAEAPRLAEYASHMSLKRKRVMDDGIDAEGQERNSKRGRIEEGIAEQAVLLM